MNTIELITIGDEILIGQIVDTNSAWMAQELNREGFQVVQITSIPDVREQLIEAFTNALKRADAILVTGGIGPTKDDITKQTLCEFFGTELVFNEEMYQNVLRQIAGRTGLMNELNRRQAYVPACCTPIVNEVGTAPVTWYERAGKILVSMPGVPKEMEQVMKNEILPRLKAHFHTPSLVHRTIIVKDYPESQLAVKLEEWENALPPFIKLAYLPQVGYIRLRLTGKNEDKKLLSETIEEEVGKLREILGAAIVATEDIAPEVLISRILKEAGLTLSVAESCTGGNIAHLLTLHPGSSLFFKGGVVAYSNEVKQHVLGVNPNDIENYGAVSREVVEQMAQGVRKVLKTDIAVATSGIAGPDGGTPEKPVGTVWIAASNSEKTISRKFQFGNFRERNIEKATFAAIFLAKELVEK
ncbi:MAG: CinA family nicotinamide mononucleotide deamidase-related protein [Prevotellaceae bacterium]|nr:CinA family nicotinamide mononucleotide deamidase-related protein [Prevotellaceae bacterium]